jgi:hypothetical protein
MAVERKKPLGVVAHGTSGKCERRQVQMNIRTESTGRKAGTHFFSDGADAAAEKTAPPNRGLSVLARLGGSGGIARLLRSATRCGRCACRLRHGRLHGKNVVVLDPPETPGPRLAALYLTCEQCNQAPLMSAGDLRAVNDPRRVRVVRLAA